MTAEIATFELPPVIKSEDCQKLGAFLAEHAEAPVNLNCAEVTRIGGQGVQMIAAHMKFRSGGEHALTIEAPSEGFITSINTMALDNLIPHAGDAA